MTASFSIPYTIAIGREKLTDLEAVKTIAKKLGATEAQVLVAWGVKRGYSVIPKSVQEGRIISNFKQVELSDEDYEAITALGHGNYTRYVVEAFLESLPRAKLTPSSL